MSRLHVPVPLRWADMDAYGHVNNVAVLRLLEEARIAVFWQHPEAADAGSWPTAVLDAGPGAATHTVVARNEIEYLQPIGYRRDPVTVELWIGRMGGASIEICYEVVIEPPEAGQRTVAVRATTTVVLLDAATARPRRISDTERAAWEPYLEPAIVWQRSGSR